MSIAFRATKPTYNLHTKFLSGIISNLPIKDEKSARTQVTERESVCVSLMQGGHREFHTTFEKYNV